MITDTVITDVYWFALRMTLVFFVGPVAIIGAYYVAGVALVLILRAFGYDLLKKK